MLDCKVSIIVPIFNVARYLCECLDSIIHQSYQNIEIILVNDGSSDESEIIALEYAKKDSRICYFSQANQGAAVARNLGLDKASGKYVAFIDADDYIDLDFIAKLVEKTTHKACVYNFNVRFKYDDKMIRYNQQKSIVGCYAINQDIISRLDFFVCNALFSREIIETYHLRFMEGKICEDAEFLFRYLAFMELVECIDSSAYYYRQYVDSTTGKLAQNRLVSMDRIDAFKSIVLWYKKYDCFSRGLPFQLLTSIFPNNINAGEFINKAQSVVKALQIPSSMYQKILLMRYFMESKSVETFFVKANLLPKKRVFSIRIRPIKKEYKIVLFGKVLVDYQRKKD